MIFGLKKIAKRDIIPKRVNAKNTPLLSTRKPTIGLNTVNISRLAMLTKDRTVALCSQSISSLMSLDRRPETCNPSPPVRERAKSTPMEFCNIPPKS